MGKTRSKNDQDGPPGPPAAVASSEEEVLKRLIAKRIEEKKQPIYLPHLGELIEEFYFG